MKEVQNKKWKIISGRKWSKLRITDKFHTLFKLIFTKIMLPFQRTQTSTNFEFAIHKSSICTKLSL